MASPDQGSVRMVPLEYGQPSRSASQDVAAEVLKDAKVDGGKITLSLKNPLSSFELRYEGANFKALEKSSPGLSSVKHEYIQTPDGREFQISDGNIVHQVSRMKVPASEVQGSNIPIGSDGYAVVTVFTKTNLTPAQLNISERSPSTTKSASSPGRYSYEFSEENGTSQIKIDLDKSITRAYLDINGKTVEVSVRDGKIVNPLGPGSLSSSSGAATGGRTPLSTRDHDRSPESLKDLQELDRGLDSVLDRLKGGKKAPAGELRLNSSDGKDETPSGSGGPSNQPGAGNGSPQTSDPSQTPSDPNSPQALASKSKFTSIEMGDLKFPKPEAPTQSDERTWPLEYGPMARYGMKPLEAPQRLSFDQKLAAFEKQSVAKSAATATSSEAELVKIQKQLAKEGDQLAKLIKGEIKDLTKQLKGYPPDSPGHGEIENRIKGLKTLESDHILKRKEIAEKLAASSDKSISDAGKKELMSLKKPVLKALDHKIEAETDAAVKDQLKDARGKFVEANKKLISEDGTRLQKLAAKDR